MRDKVYMSRNKGGADLRSNVAGMVRALASTCMEVSKVVEHARSFARHLYLPFRQTYSMLECRSCLFRCLRAIVGDSQPAARLAPKIHGRLSPRSRIAHHSIRGYQTTTAHDSGGKYAVQNGDHPPHLRNEPLSRDERRIAMNRRDRSKAETGDGDSRMLSVPPEQERALKQELKYLKDPLKLADHVRHVLRGNDLDKALALCRMASKQMQCIVSWNHCIDWLMTRKDIDKAMKLYNEMKKRGQFPDSYSYVIILRGLANPPVHSATVGKALSVYHSLASPNSRVVQSIIHTNAALKVCSRAHDMDSLWGIASRIPERGPGAADNFTFTTILNAIRENALLESGPRQDADHIAAQRERAVVEGRRIWGDIVGKWRAGSLIVDEELVCSMGRLLLIGMRPRDWDDVLSLIEQTMDIPRLAAKLGTQARKAEHLSIPRDLKDAMESEEDGEHLVGEFDRDLVRSKRGGSAAFVRPGNNTLSLLVEACIKMVSPKVADQYWQLLTAKDGHGLSPDLDNLHMYLRLLRQSRGSARAVEALRNEVVDKNLTPLRKTFRIAMSTCVRDKNNRNVMKNAAAILDMMESNISELDAKTLVMYLDLAISSGSGPVISEAIWRLGPHVQNLKSQLSYGLDGSRGRTNEADADETLLLFRTIVGAIDHLLNKSMVPKEDHTAWAQRRSKLAAYLTRQNNKNGENVGTRFKPAKFAHANKLDMRRESRQLRNLRRNETRREKKADNSWVDRNTNASKAFGDLPSDLDDSR